MPAKPRRAGELLTGNGKWRKLDCFEEVDPNPRARLSRAMPPQPGRPPLEGDGSF